MRKTAILMLFVAAAAMSAQNVGETVVVQLIEIPVTVVGGDGKAVRGLTREDFELFDEGKRVPFEYFEVLDMKALSAAPAKVRPPAAATRNFLLLFDVANSSPGSLKRAAEAAKEFVLGQLGPRDLAAVATFGTEEGLRVVTAFTSDAKMLTAAMESVGNATYFKVADPLMISFKETSQLDAPTFAVPTTEGEVRRAERELSIAQAAEALLDPTTTNKMRGQSNDAELRNRLRIQLENMGSVARMLDRLHGQKQVVLLSEGFDPRLVRGEDVRTDTRQVEEDRRRMLGEVWDVDSDKRFGTAGAGRDVSEMVQLFRRSDVVLHAIDIKGLRGNTDAGAFDAAARRSNESLFMITRPTGGTVFQNSNDFAETFARMLEQQEVVYLLGFQAKSSGRPGAFHDLKVKTTARGVRVAHRAGYYEPTAGATNLEKTLTTAEILLTDAPVHDVDVAVTATTIPGPEGKARVPVLVEIDGASLLEGLFGTNATANLFLYAFDAKSGVADYLTQRMSLNLIEAKEALSNGLRYFATLRLPPGDYAIKVVARVEDTARAGFARTDVHVPEFGRPIVLPPVLVDDMANWAMLAGPVRGDDYAYPFAAGEDRFVQRARAVLGASGEYKLVLLAYDVPLENATVTASVAAAGAGHAAQPASVSIIGRTPPDGWNGTKLFLAFRPTGLAPGAYELRLAVQPQGGEGMNVTMPFTVR